MENIVENKIARVLPITIVDEHSIALSHVSVETQSESELFRLFQRPMIKNKHRFRQDQGLLQKNFINCDINQFINAS